MPLKKSSGNMYPWTTHTISFLGGECPHRCSYCYVQALERRFKSGRYAGKLRLFEHELKIPLGQGRIIFIEHMNDLFADAVPAEWIERILQRVADYPGNAYVFQTKNPERLVQFLDHIPIGSIVGTTIESDASLVAMHDAPPPYDRFQFMLAVKDQRPDLKLFVTVEPIMDFDVEILSSWIAHLHPEFVNIGADSKGSGLVEPTAEKINALISAINRKNIEIREKHNLGRLLK